MKLLCLIGRHDWKPAECVSWQGYLRYTYGVFCTRCDKEQRT